MPTNSAYQPVMGQSAAPHPGLYCLPVPQIRRQAFIRVNSDGLVKSC